MNEIIQELECNATNGKENFCYISEKKLKPLKELSKREEQEKETYKQALLKIKEINEDDNYDIAEAYEEIIHIVKDSLGGVDNE